MEFLTSNDFMILENVQSGIQDTGYSSFDYGYDSCDACSDSCEGECYGCCTEGCAGCCEGDCEGSCVDSCNSRAK